MRRIAADGDYSFSFFFCRGQDAAADAAIAADRRDLARRLDHHVVLLDADGVDLDAHRGILEALARRKGEVLLVDRRGDDELTLDVADDPAREDVGAREGITIAYRIEAVVGEAAVAN